MLGDGEWTVVPWVVPKPKGFKIFAILVVLQHINPTFRVHGQQFAFGERVFGQSDVENYDTGKCQSLGKWP